jgi:Mg2+ and Co2+ transporter CorA
MKDETMTVAQVQAALDAAQQTVERFEQALREVQEDVARIEARAGETALDNPERVNELAAELAQTQGLATVTARGLETAQKREQEAQLLLLRAQASEKRATAAELREQAQSIDDECEPLLERLSALQGGCRYIVHRRIAAVGVHSDPLPYPETPRSTILRDQAAALEQQAASLEQRAQQQRARLVELVPTPEPQPAA